jgi:hypothetical protein
VVAGVDVFKTKLTAQAHDIHHVSEALDHVGITRILE